MPIVDLISTFGDLFIKWALPIAFFSSLVEMSPLGWIIPAGGVISVTSFFVYPDTALLTQIIVVGTIGGLITFLAAYYLGDKSGSRLIKRLGQEKYAKRSEILLKKHGPVIMTTSMMAGLTRFWIAYVAGMHRYKFKYFFVYSLLASLTWMSLMSVIGFIAGAQIERLKSSATLLGVVSWGLIFVSIGIIYWKSKKEFGSENSDDNTRN